MPCLFKKQICPGPCWCTQRFGIEGMNYHNAVLDNPCTHTRQAFLLFAISVAGKKADLIVPKLREFFVGIRPRELPFTFVLRIGGDLEDRLRLVKMGRYGTLASAYWDVARKIDVDNTSVEELEGINGIGPKTARYFMMYAHGLECAVIDTHIKKFLRECGIMATGYADLEKAYLERARALLVSPADLDNWIWRHFARAEDTGYDHIMSELRRLSLAPHP